MTETIGSVGLQDMARPNQLDPPADLARLRDTAPISRLRFPDGHLGWLVTGHGPVRKIMADNRFSALQEIQHLPITKPDGEILTPMPTLPGFFLTVDPPEHTRYRRLLTGQFTVRRMRLFSDAITAIVDGRLRAIREHGSPADLLTEFALPVPLLVICELLGVPEEQRDEFSRVVLHLDNTFESRLLERMQELVAHKRAHPGDDVLSGLIATGALTGEELTNMALLLVIAGQETTGNTLGLAAFALLTHDEQLGALRADPSLIANAVEELLRYVTVIQFGAVRTATADVEIDGVLIRAGETVSLSLPAANRDPARFAAPDDLDITQNASGHMSFGHGVHQCIGQQLARVELQIALGALFREFPDLRLAVPPDEVRLRNEMVKGLRSLPVEFS